MILNNMKFTIKPNYVFGYFYNNKYINSTKIIDCLIIIQIK